MAETKFDLNQGLSGKYSIFKVFHHKKKIESFLEEEVVTPPIAIRIKPTNKCNHGCFYCVYESSFSGIHPDMKREDELSKEKIMEVLEDLRDMGVRAATYSGGGEPLMHPNITQAFQKTLDYKIGLSLITNGLNLSGEKAELLAEADWVRVSIDYCDAEMMRKIRQKDKSAFDQTTKNLHKFAKIKKANCDFEANCVIHEHNFDRLYDIAKFLKEQGIENVRFAPCWFPKFEAYHDKFREIVIEQIEKAKQIGDRTFSVGSTYEKYFKDNTDSTKRPERCYWMQVVPVIAADYNVYTCHNKAYDPSGTIGSIKSISFKNLWFSKKSADFFMKFNPRENCNHECSSHERNVLISEWLACADPKLCRYP